MKAIWKDTSQYVRPLFIIFFISNFIGLFLYFVFDTSISDLARAEQRNYYDGSDGITFFCTVVPVLMCCLLVNILWGIKALVDIQRRKNFCAFVAGVIVAVLWAANFG